ncbi:MAG: FlgO family outer membrane protein [Deltaproteobacteria bacterium]|nr:FlgO family outer membrane protein [Deltaproteobacteria bacterium]
MSKKRCLIKTILPTLCVILLLCGGSENVFAYEQAISKISATLAKSVVKSGKKSIAVVDFSDLQGNVTELGRFLAEEISGDLAITAQGFEIIDRTHLKSILAEHNLSLSGLVDQKTVKKLGKIAGVDAVITGSVTPFGDSIRITCKIIATDTARVFGAAKGDIAKTKAIEDLLARGIDDKHSSGTPVSAGKTASSRIIQGKTVGPVVIVVKRITVDLRAKATVNLDIFSKLQRESGFALDLRQAAKIVDERGNSFKLSDGMPVTDISGGWSGDGLRWPKLSPMSNNDISLVFVPEDHRVASKDIGNMFSLSMTFGIMSQPGRKETTSLHSVSFDDIKVQPLK